MLDWRKAPKPIIALSPMADLTDSAFCRIAKRHGAPYVFREMVSADAVVHGNAKTLGMTRFEEEERPIVQQVFGSDPETMARAIETIDRLYAPDAFDINMGCPATKITCNFNGAALMRQPEAAADILRAAKKATPRPVSVKMRLGWSRPEEVLDFAPRIEEAGADLISIHGRTKEQGYAGIADWAAIARARERVSIPVLANGDVFTPEAALAALRTTGAAGVLIARGALGNPWIFRRIAAAVAGQELPEPDMAVRLAVIREHAALHAAADGGSLKGFRKHLVYYFKGLPGARRLREHLSRISVESDLEKVLRDIA